MSGIVLGALYVLAHSIITTHFLSCIIIIPILQIRKLRQKEVNLPIMTLRGRIRINIEKLLNRIWSMHRLPKE